MHIGPINIVQVGDFMSKQFNAGKFSDIYKTELGQKLWDFMNKFETKIRLETACDLGKPAVEAIQKHLLHEFGDAVREIRVKQMIGLMVRQVLETRDFMLDTQNVRLKNGILFMKGSRYLRTSITPLNQSDDTT